MQLNTYYDDHPHNLAMFGGFMRVRYILTRHVLDRGANVYQTLSIWE